VANTSFSTNLGSESS